MYPNNLTEKQLGLHYYGRHGFPPAKKMSNSTAKSISKDTIIVATAVIGWFTAIGTVALIFG